MTATQKQKDAFADLLTAACYTNPVPTDLSSCLNTVPIIAALYLVYRIPTIGLIGSDASHVSVDNYNAAVAQIEAVRVFNELASEYSRLTSWTDSFFTSSNPPFQQQHISNMMSLAASVDATMNAMEGGRPHWNLISVFSPASPDDVSPLYLEGHKFNIKWYDDLLGSVTGVLLPSIASTVDMVESASAAHPDVYGELSSLFQQALEAYTVDHDAGEFINNIKAAIMSGCSLNCMQLYTTVYAPQELFSSNAYVTYTYNTNNILQSYESELLKYTSETLPYANVNPVINANAFAAYTDGVEQALDAEYDTLCTSSVALFPSITRFKTSLERDVSTISSQINREQWWWYPLTDDQYFSHYSRAAQVATSGGIAVSIHGLSNKPDINHTINRTASPAVILAKDEAV